MDHCPDENPPFPTAWSIAIAVLMLSPPCASWAQHTAALKAYTFQTIGGLYTLGYEHALSKQLSAEISMQGGQYIDVRPNSKEDYEVTGTGAVGALRYFPFAQKVVAPRGLFGYAAVRYIRFNEAFVYLTSGDPIEVRGSIANAGLGIGYKFVYRRLGLEMIVGWGTGHLKSDDDEYRNKIPTFYRMGIEEQQHFPQLDVAVCYMFSPFHKN